MTALSAAEVMRDLDLDADELAQLVLDLCQIPSPTGREGGAGEFVYRWMLDHGIQSRKIGLLPERFNVLGRIPGRSNGLSLIFNSHLDTGKHPEDRWSLRDAGNPLYNSAWREGDLIFGEGVVNDKGPMAAWLIAAKAVRDAGIPLEGDLLLSAVAGEIGTEPVDEYDAPRYLSKELGTRYLIQHGGVADYALNAEGTGFTTGWIEPGKAFFKITVFGGAQRYTPFAGHDGPDREHPNAIVRAATLVPTLQRWGRDYTRRFTYEAKGGTVVPNVVIGAIRGGNPYHVTRTSELCSLYLDVRIIPDQDVLALRGELQDLLGEQGLEGEVELFVYRRAYEADEPGVLLDSIREVHRAEFGEEPAMAPAPFTSMWRDLNPFNEMGIPSITYGPGTSVKERYALSIDELVRTARVYAGIAVDVCSRARPASTSQRSTTG